jgi:hypothetical protein
MAAETELYGPNVLLMGGSGTGKTHSISTLVEWAQRNGREVFCLFTENGLETLLSVWRDRGLEVPACLHWHQQLTRPLGLARIMDAAEKVGKMSYEMLTKLQDANRSGAANENNAFWQILSSCADFPDDRTGKKFGSIDSWGTDRIFVLDSLTELSNAAMKMQVGNRPAAAPPDYGVAQGNLMNFLRLCTQGCKCTFVLTAHVDRYTDEVTQTTKISVRSVGQALAPEIPTIFSEVLYTVREADRFYWDTVAYGVEAKTRSLGYRGKIDPNFAQIMDLWLKRRGEGKS